MELMRQEVFEKGIFASSELQTSTHVHTYCSRMSRIRRTSGQTSAFLFSASFRLLVLRRLRLRPTNLSRDPILYVLVLREI